MARTRRHEAEADAEAADIEFARLTQQQDEHIRRCDSAQRTLNQVAETRRLLAPAVAAASVSDSVREQLPALRQAASETRRHKEELDKRRPAVVAKAETASGLVRDHRRHRDDAAETLRAAGLAPVTDGQVPTDDETTIRARLAGAESALRDGAIDPQLHERLGEARSKLADLETKLGTDRELRGFAEHFAASDGARHPVALSESVREATEWEAHAREECAKARATGSTPNRSRPESTNPTSADTWGRVPWRNTHSPPSGCHWHAGARGSPFPAPRSSSGPPSSCPAAHRNQHRPDSPSCAASRD